ncbi:hypothetical protein EV361DRAFT_913945 [Lentinula raphanica]|nr:hypothetical protein F5880DRAFT_978831 [Lentinula raphanica]KAJ3970870.1 hypothetical protein EV361DRAFT_913945 [Lentinula raphanica]
MVTSPLQQSNVEQLSAAALLSASWVNMVLFGVELVLCAYCLGWRCHFPDDKVTLRLPNTPVLNGDSPWVKKQAPKSTSIGSKWFILVALLNDTLCTVALCLDTYYIVRQASETSMISNNRLWPTAVWIFTTSFATTLEQTYFLYRYWTISKNRIITSMLAALILCNFFFIFVIDAGFIPTSNNMLVLQKFDAPFVSAAIITIVDISLSLVLVWKLKSVKTTRLPTQRLLRKICIFVVGYGAITAVSSALMLVMWAVNVNGYLSIVYCLGRIYSLTVLCNFLFVSGWRDEAATAHLNDGFTSDLTGKANRLSGVLEELPQFKFTSHPGIELMNHNPPLYRTQPSSIQLNTITQKDVVAPSFSVDTL